MAWRRALFGFAIVFLTVSSLSFAYGIFLLVRSRAFWASQEALAPTIQPPDVLALLERAAEHLEKGEVEQALVAYRRILTTTPSVEAQLGLAEAELRAGREDVAIQEYERTLRLDPGNAAALERLARLYTYRKDTWRKAEKAYRDYLSVRPEDSKAHLELARLLSWLGRTRQALELFSRADVRPLLTPQDRREYALALVEAGRGDQAEHLLEETLSLTPSDDDVRLALAGLHASRGDWDAALPSYRVVLRKSPDDGGLNLMYGQGLLAQGNHKAAVAPLEKACRAEPTNRQAALAYARALRGAGDLKGAERQFERVMVSGAEGERDPAVAREYADLLLERGNPRDAESYYRRAMALGLSDDRLLLGLGGALQASGKPQEAVRYLEEVYQRRPTDRLAYNLARLYQKLGRNERALEILAELERSVRP